MSDETVSTLKIVDEQDETPFVEYDISVSPSDPNLELIAQQIEREDIIIPFYQRKYVWKIEQASKLIESFLMGLPVPQIFLYVNQSNQLEVIDGQQRVMSIKYFFDGFFGEEDNKGRRKTFRLKGLSERSEYNGKTFSELLPKDQRKLNNSTLRAINIRQLTPDQNNDSVFHIFQRLNTGGTRLRPQEIRNAVYRGPIVESLKELNEDVDWQEILGLKQADPAQKDVELVLRLFGLFTSWSSYEKPMLGFLNKVMAQNREYDSLIATRFKDEFPRVTELVNSTLNKPFRPRGVINSAVLEAVMIALLEDEDIDAIKLEENYPKLMKNSEFLNRITGGTTDTKILQGRIEIAKRVLSDG